MELCHHQEFREVYKKEVRKMKNYIIFLSVTMLYFSSQALSAQNVGINIENPQAELDVNGNVRIGSVKPFKDTYKRVLRNKKTGKLSVESSSADRGKIRAIRYEIKNGMYGQFRIDNYDTKISTRDYYVYIMSSNLVKTEVYLYRTDGGSNDSNGRVARSAADKENLNIPTEFHYGLTHKSDGSNPIKEVEAFKDGGTWRFRANYPGANIAIRTPDPQKIFRWVIDVMVIHRSLINDYSETPIEASVSGSQYSGSANTNNTVIREL